MTATSGRRVVVFGGAGFVGSAVADALSDAGYHVTVFDRRPSPYLRPDQRGIVGDILDAASVSSAVAGSDVIYNYAGIADIAEASREPLESVRLNILGNTILLEAARHAAVKRFMFASTLYVYSSSGAFYRSTKQASELIIEDYQKTFGLEYTILRYGSLYGPRADRNNWIWRMLHDAVFDGCVRRAGEGDEIREYIHVFDAARSSVDVLAPEFANQHVIISGQQSIRVRDLLNMVRGMLNGKVQIEYTAPDDSAAAANLHYQFSPYSFNPRIAQKVMRTSYVDLGQGLLDLIEQIYRAGDRQRDHERV